jgi:MFS family permease
MIGPLKLGLVRSSFAGDLRAVLAERDFRKLFGSRLVSELGDGLFSASFTAYVFFGAQTFTVPSEAVAAFAVQYLPYSLIGPFAGVFIDRWSRRQVLVISAFVRAAMVAFSGFVVLSGQTGLPLYICVLAVLGASRFFLAAVSAATPHVVPRDKLVMANAVAPTSGTILAFVGGVVGIGVPVVTGGGHSGAAATMWFAGLCYVVSGLFGARLARDLLGPGRLEHLRRGIVSELTDVARGLAGGVRHLGERRRAAYALGAVGVHRGLYATLLVQGLLLYRNYFYAGGAGDQALSHATWLVVTSAVGYGFAAVVTPAGVRRLSKPAWITVWLLIGGLTTIVLGPSFRQDAYLVMGFLMGLSAQCVKICVDTTEQETVDDEYMGRVFSLYDMISNVAYVAGPAIALPFMPVSGKSYVLVIAIGVCYLVAGAVYATLTRGPRAGERQSPPAWPTPATRP